MRSIYFIIFCFILVGCNKKKEIKTVDEFVLERKHVLNEFSEDCFEEFRDEYPNSLSIFWRVYIRSGREELIDKLMLTKTDNKLIEDYNLVEIGAGELLYSDFRPSPLDAVSVKKELCESYLDHVTSSLFRSFIDIICSIISEFMFVCGIILIIFCSATSFNASFSEVKDMYFVIILSLILSFYFNPAKRGYDFFVDNNDPVKEYIQKEVSSYAEYTNRFEKI